MSLAVSRRAFVALGGAGLVALGAPNIAFGLNRILRVSVIGGGPGDAFDSEIFPAFTAATGIAVQGVARPADRRWLDVLASAAENGQAPADVSMLGRNSVAEGIEARLWAPLQRSKIQNAARIGDAYFDRYPDGKIAGIAAVTWQGHDVSGSWVVLRTSQAAEEAHAFINFMCHPAIQISLATGKGWSLDGGPASALKVR